MNPVSFTGGSRIGWINASWPFARLSVTAGRLTLKTLGSYEFSPKQVIALEKEGSIPLLSSGIRIVHNRSDYPEKVIFWCVGGRDRVLRKIAESGFVAHGTPASTPRAKGMPLRWSVVIGSVVVWNLLMMLEFPPGATRSSHVPGLYFALACFLAFAFSTAIRLSPRVQSLVLREGHSVGAIKSFLTLLQLITGLMILVFSFMHFAGAP
jgi:hypothetical protein